MYVSHVHVSTFFGGGVADGSTSWLQSVSWTLPCVRFVTRCSICFFVTGLSPNGDPNASDATTATTAAATTKISTRTRWNVARWRYAAAPLRPHAGRGTRLRARRAGVPLELRRLAQNAGTTAAARALVDQRPDGEDARRDRGPEVAPALGEHPHRDAVGHREEDVGDGVRRRVQPQDAGRLLLDEQVGDVLARAPQQLRELERDLLVAARQREELEHQRDDRRVVDDHVLQRLDEPVDDVVGALGVGELLVDQVHPQLAVAAHDLGEKPLLRAELVVQQPARDPRLARDVVERGCGDAAPRDARAHRVDDPRRLVALDGPLSGRRLHAVQTS